MILDAAETILGYIGFDRTVYENPTRNGRKKKNKCMTNCSKKGQKIFKQRYMMENDNDNILSSRKD
jgi:hypothetical protein